MALVSQNFLAMSGSPNRRIKLSLHGCPPELPGDLQRLYPEVWKRLCALAAKTQVRFDLAAGTVRHRGRTGRWKPLPSPAEGESLLSILKTIAALPRRSMNPKSETAAIIMGGGTGSRFGDSDSQKVLYPVKGIPAIDRLMERCHEADCSEIVVVVGWFWHEVVEHIEARYNNVHYMFQPEQLGTGDAARCGARYLAANGFEGDVLILAGDKVLAPGAIKAILSTHREQQADMTLASASKAAWPGSGRVVLEDDIRVLAIFEQPDVARDRILEMIENWPDDHFEPEVFLKKARELQPNAKKLKKSFKTPLWELLEKNEPITKSVFQMAVDGIERGFKVMSSNRQEKILRGSEIEKTCDLVNVSLYAFRAKPLYEILERLQSGNAQGELYLTDAAQLLANGQGSNPNAIVASHRLDDDYDAAGFNTLEELSAIEERMKE